MLTYRSYVGFDPAGMTEFPFVNAGTGLHVYLAREGMKASRADDTETSARNALANVYKRSEVHTVLDMLAAETMHAFFQCLSSIGSAYLGLRELDLSGGLAIMSSKDFANMRRDGYHVHPQGHAALTQQALPIDIAALFTHLFPWTTPLLPGLTLLHLKFVKVIFETLQMSAQKHDPYIIYAISSNVRHCCICNTRQVVLLLLLSGHAREHCAHCTLI